METTYRYPCTRQVETAGFAQFLEANLGQPRENLRAFAAALGARFEARHVALVNSGSSANLAAALALAERTGPGAHAITAGFTFPTTAASLKTAGFEVTVVDTEPGGFCIDPQAVERALKPNTRLLCVTHFLGFPAQMEALSALARAGGLFVLQDGCETMDLQIAGKRAHMWGDILTWSFYHPHHLSSFGGGALVCADDAWLQQVESITHWGRACTCHYDPSRCKAPPGARHHFHYIRSGHNLEMSELNACFGRFQLDRWPQLEARRWENYRALYDALSPSEGVKVYAARAGMGSPFVFPFTFDSFARAEAVLGQLRARGVEVRTLMGGAITDQPAWAALAHDGLAHCRALAKASAFVGLHQTLPLEDVKAVAALIAQESQT